MQELEDCFFFIDKFRNWEDLTEWAEKDLFELRMLCLRPRQLIQECLRRDPNFEFGQQVPDIHSRGYANYAKKFPEAVKILDRSVKLVQTLKCSDCNQLWGEMPKTSYDLREGEFVRIPIKAGDDLCEVIAVKGDRATLKTVEGYPEEFDIFREEAIIGDWKEMERNFKW